MNSVTFALKPLPPFRLDLTVWVLRRRPDNLLDRWDGTTYRRTLALQGIITIVAVRQTGTIASPALSVTLFAPRLDTDMAKEAAVILERMLGLHIDLSGFYDLAASDRQLSVLAERFRGMKPTRYPTLFEGFVNAVACQQLTLSFGIQLINRIVHSFGPPKSPDGDTAHAFPQPDDVAWLEPAEFRALGFSRRKGETLIGLAHAMLEGRLLPEGLETLDDEAARNALCSLHGIGRWSAEYILLRSLGRLNVFPGDDVGAQKNLQRWLQLPKQPDYQGVRKLLARWQPYGGLVYFHLLLEQLAAAGLFSDAEF
jgi:DNA-3-methyladenine glycosylase II